jgi:hypothetical protein
MKSYIETTYCEVCGHGILESVLNLGNHPLCDDLVEIGGMRQCLEYPIEILFCRQCFTAHQRYQVPKKDLFPKSKTGVPNVELQNLQFIIKFT